MDLGKKKTIECVHVAQTYMKHKIRCVMCGKSIIDQTGRCLNDRLSEHHAHLEAIAGPGHLADHCLRCQCNPLFDITHMSEDWSLKHLASKKVLAALASCLLASHRKKWSIPQSQDEWHACTVKILCL